MDGKVVIIIHCLKASIFIQDYFVASNYYQFLTLTFDFLLSKVLVPSKCNRRWKVNLENYCTNNTYIMKFCENLILKFYFRVAGTII